jgi:phosphoglucosamine mutase
MTSVRALFGTDGIRGRANQHPMTPELALSLGRAVGWTLYHALRRETSEELNSGGRPYALIGRDTRASGDMIENALVAGLCSVGIDAHLIGVIPTPAVAQLTAQSEAFAGLMISASHNPFYDNGVKVFAHDGYKLPDELEAQIEALLITPELNAHRPIGAEVGRATLIDDAEERYLDRLKSATSSAQALAGLKVVLDAANGAASSVAPRALEALGAEVIPIFCSPDGVNINQECGATHLDALTQAVLDHQADVGVALDGDADRCLLIDERGQILDGDQIITLLARDFLQRDRLPHRRVVTTVMSNLGLDEALSALDVTVDRVQVGDRYVMERMRAEGLSLGGEQSGHTIIHDYATTGDGLLTAILSLALCAKEGQKMSALGGAMRHFPQALKSFEVPAKPELNTLTETMTRVAEIEARLGASGRVFVRYSGTQQMARVMVEGPAQAQVDADTHELAHLMLTEIERSLT